MCLLVVAACGGDDAPTPTEQACEGWRDLLLEEPAPSDDEAQAELTRLIDLGPDDPVNGLMVAVRARLRDGSDISSAYEALSDECS